MGEASMRSVTRLCALSAIALLSLPAASTAVEMRGVTATEIKIGRSGAIPAGDPGRAGAVPLRGAALCALCAGEKSECQIRGDLAERRFRPRLSSGPEGRARRKIRFARHRCDLRNIRSDHRLA